ncbi:MAG TPA: hypothetical protein VGR31_11115 [Planctomycetota bacterium]|jgi:type II secretory pathway component PulK|nr:hypothetical protein [Planctomycetota bacterium]
MRLLRSRSAGRTRSRSGAALLLSLLILLVLVAIVIQITVGTSTDARVARNDIGLTTMDLAVESALLQVDDQLLQDAKSAGADASAGGPSTPAAGGGGGTASPAGAAGAAGGAATSCDSRKDDWARPQRTTLNDIRLRILVQDEDSKINVLNMLNPDEKEAQAAYDRVVRCLDLCREGTLADIDSHTADEMARAMLEYMKQRKDSHVPRPTLLSDDPHDEEKGLPLSLKEFAVLRPFDESHFRDFRDSDGKVVHSIGSFLTVWSSIATTTDAAKVTGVPAPPGAAAAGSTGTPGGASTAGGTTGGTTGGAGGKSTGGSSTTGGAGAAGGASGAGNGTTPGSGGAAAPGGASNKVDTGGYAVNVNTAPVAVLKSLFDGHELPPRFFDRVIEYRNTEAEKPKETSETEDIVEPLDEFGDPIIDRKIFDSLSKLSEVDGYQDLPTDVQAKLNSLLTVESRVFSIFVVARRSTSAAGDQSDVPTNREDLRAREQAGDSLLRIVRSVVWRHKVDGDYVIVPLVRWEVIDYVPFEVQDYPDEER